jgi:hypothetical protein
LLFVVESRFERGGRPPHLLQLAVAGECEEVVPIRIGHDQLDERLEIGGDDPGLTFGCDIKHALGWRQQRENAARAILPDLPYDRDSIDRKPRWPLGLDCDLVTACAQQFGGVRVDDQVIWTEGHVGSPESLLI